MSEAVTVPSLMVKPLTVFKESLARDTHTHTDSGSSILNKTVPPLPSTRTNELHVCDQYANEREQSLFVWSNNKMEAGQTS